MLIHLIVQVPHKVNGKCACVGGSMLFGENENGRTFFKPNRDELIRYEIL